MSTPLVRPVLPAVLGVAALVCLCVSLAVLFKAGCAGDLKTGGLGYPTRALELESAALSFYVVGLALGGAALAVRAGRALQRRVADALAFIIFGGLLFWLVAIQVEVWGVQHCFNAIAL